MIFTQSLNSTPKDRRSRFLCYKSIINYLNKVTGYSILVLPTRTTILDSFKKVLRNVRSVEIHDSIQEVNRCHIYVLHISWGDFRS